MCFGILMLVSDSTFTWKKVTNFRSIFSLSHFLHSKKASKINKQSSRLDKFHTCLRFPWIYTWFEGKRTLNDANRQINKAPKDSSNLSNHNNSWTLELLGIFFSSNKQNVFIFNLFMNSKTVFYILAKIKTNYYFLRDGAFPVRSYEGIPQIAFQEFLNEI